MKAGAPTTAQSSRLVDGRHEAPSPIGSFTSRFAFIRQERVAAPGGPTEHARRFRVRQAGDADEFIRTRDNGVAIELHCRES